MALSPRQLTLVHRRQQLALRKVTLAEMERLWPALDWENLDSTYPALAGAAAGMVAKYRRTSAGLAAAYLRAYRVASGLDGDVKIFVPPALNVKQLDASLHATSVAHIKAAAARGVAADVAMSNALTQAAGSMARLVLDSGRETVVQTVRSDPRALGWQRVLGGGGCDFCRMLAGRGAVYGEDSAGFDAHDRCGCTSEAVYTEAQANKPTSDWVPPKSRNTVPEQTDVDASRSLAELRTTLAALEKSLAKFDSPGTRARIEDLRRKIAARS
jgi:hypothetical protein